MNNTSDRKMRRLMPAEVHYELARCNAQYQAAIAAGYVYATKFGTWLFKSTERPAANSSLFKTIDIIVPNAWNSDELYLTTTRLQHQCLNEIGAILYVMKEYTQIIEYQKLIREYIKNDDLANLESALALLHLQHDA